MKHLIIFISSLLQLACVAQKPLTKQVSTSSKPKVIVGIMVDQMRYDFLYRFYDKYSEGGFKRLMNDGFNCKNNHYHYASTVTGPGHAHVYTGSIPSFSGITGNEWYNKFTKTDSYVVQDDDVSTIGDEPSSAGQMSPKNLLATTITDQLNIANQFRSKIVGVAIKDRGAILPAGHTGDAYWYNSRSAKWITSTFYKDKAPAWLDKFNALKLPEKYSEVAWTPVLGMEDYYETEEDDQPYENRINGEEKAVFPHRITPGGIASTPAGNTLTLDFALAAFENEQMGKDDITDFLAISFSSPDYAGHAFGPQSKEIEDMYLKLDLEIQRLLNKMDAEVGKGNYTVFLTADHGVAEIPAFLKKHNIPAGVFLTSEYKKPLDDALLKNFGEGEWILATDNYQFYLNKPLMREKGVTKAQILAVAQEVLLPLEGVHDVIDLEDISEESVPPYFKTLLSNIYHPKRSGELMLLLDPAWFTGYTRGTTHGTMYNYDTHVPLVFYGWGVKQGETSEPTFISDIAASLAQILNILEPNACVGTPVEDLFD